MINNHNAFLVMKSKLLLFIFLITAFISCTKRYITPESNSLAVPKELIGSWQWNYTIAGIFSTYYTPQSTGLNIRIQFDADHNYKYYENGTEFVNTKFILENRISLKTGDSALILSNIPSSPDIIIFKGIDSLVLIVDDRSNYENHYSRLK